MTTTVIIHVPTTATWKVRVITRTRTWDPKGQEFRSWKSHTGYYLPGEGTTLYIHGDLKIRSIEERHLSTKDVLVLGRRERDRYKKAAEETPVLAETAGALVDNEDKGREP